MNFGHFLVLHVERDLHVTLESFGVKLNSVFCDDFSRLLDGDVIGANSEEQRAQGCTLRNSVARCDRDTSADSTAKFRSVSLIRVTSWDEV